MSLLFIKGVKEPFAVTREEALDVQKVLENPKVDKEQIVTVAGWTGPKKDLRYVTVDKEKTYSSTKQFSNEEMREFGKTELAPYLKNGQLTLGAELQFYADKGFARVKALKDEPKTFSDYDFAIIDVGGYKDASEKVDGFKSYCDRVAFAKKKDEENLEAIAEQQHAR